MLTIAGTLSFIIGAAWVIYHYNALTSSGERNDTEQRNDKMVVSPVADPAAHPYPQAVDIALKIDQLPQSVKEKIISYENAITKLLRLGQGTTAPYLRLWTNKKEYQIGDHVTYHIETTQSIFLIVFNLTTEGELVQIFPNKFSKSSFVEAHQAVSIPGVDTGVDLIITGPQGKEELVAIVSEEPVSLLPVKYEKSPFFVLEKNDSAAMSQTYCNILVAEKYRLAQKRTRYFIQE